MQRQKFVFSFLMILAFLALTQWLFAGTTGKIAGDIKDADTGEPLPGVNVVLVGTVMGGATDADGYYFILNIPPGIYTMEASMIGYETTRQTDIRVSVDHTTPVTFTLKPTVISGEAVTVVAEREVIQMDMSASQIASSAAEINDVPLVRDVQQFINLQAGIENDLIRGGGLDQTQFMVDGLSVVDNRTNQPVNMVNLSSISEVTIIKGGFNAEYGNVRSGLINIVTKEPSNNYTGSIDVRMTTGTRKHGGASIFDADNWLLRPYLDDAVCWTGTSSGGWDEYTQQQYLVFEGWNSLAAKHELNSDADPNNNVTAQDLQNAFKYLHTIGGLHPNGDREYGEKPDWRADISLGGPVPGIGKSLGNLTFFASYFNNWEQWAIPTSTDWFKENNSMFKLTSKISPQMKLTFDVLYGETETVANTLNGEDGNSGGVGRYMTSGSNIIYRAENRILGRDGDRATYYPGTLNPFYIYRNVYGISFDHVLSPSTFYQVRASFVGVRERSENYLAQRNPTIIAGFGGLELDEAPYGVTGVPGPYDDQTFTIYGEQVTGVSIVGAGSGPKLMLGDNNYYGAHSAGQRNHSNSYAWNLKFDLTSQLDKYNQAKIGFQLNYDDLYTYHEKNRWESTWENKIWEWHHFPIRFGGYVQNKLEFEGMIANFGLRVDYNDPNSLWFDFGGDTYSKWYKAKYKFQIFDQPELFSEAKGKVKISPRLGISHPISANSKLYFNYGHFYSMPSSEFMYQVNWGRLSNSILEMGNPSLEIPKTVAYELGWEFDLNDMWLFHVSGYYKDVSDQSRRTEYTSFDTQVDYDTWEAREYEDIRGFEIRIDKRFGKWITGWVNYNYIVNTTGYIGRNHYYEDPRLQLVQGLEDPYQEVPTARPYARASLLVRSPADFGPDLGGFKPLANVRFNTLFSYKAGRYESFDPLEADPFDPPQIIDNVQWKSTYVFDIRVSKVLRMAGMNWEVFMDVNNLFNSYVFPNDAFYNDDDRLKYFESLHLPMYNEQKYKDAGYTGGDDKPGMLREDKDYINDPNIDYLFNLDPRTIWFGLRMDF